MRYENKFFLALLNAPMDTKMIKKYFFFTFSYPPTSSNLFWQWSQSPKTCTQILQNLVSSVAYNCG